MDIQSSSSRSWVAALLCNQHRQASSGQVELNPPLVNDHQGPQIQPSIVNSDAQKLSKQRKTLDTSAETIFRTLRGCLHYKKNFTPDDYEECARTFKNRHPELYSYIVKNGSDVRETMVQYIRNPNSPLPQKIQEMLYWLPGIAGKNIPLEPEIVSGILRKFIMKGFMPEEIAEELTKDGNFVFALTEIPFKALEANVLSFSENDTEVLREFLLTSLRHLYLHALQSTELVTHLIWTLETNDENVLTRLLEISQPEFFNRSTWRYVEELFKEAISEPLADDPQLLRETAQKFRCWMTNLTELERALFLNKEHLLFLAEKSFNYDQITPTFPICQKQFPILFSQLDLCRTEFNSESVLKAVGLRFMECQNLLGSLQPKEGKADLYHFFSTYDLTVYQASLLLLSELISSEELKANRPEGNLTEEFLYNFCVEYFGSDPIEWIQRLLEALSPADFALLEEEFRQVPLNHYEASLERDLQENVLLEKRADLLIGHLKEKLQLPRSPADFKNRFDFHSGEPV